MIWRGCKLTQKPPPLAGEVARRAGGRVAAGCRSPTACGRSPLASEGALGIVRFFMLFSVFYLSLFLSVGLLSARRAVPDGSAAVIVPLGCGFGVSLLAVLPALFAVVLGFTLPAAALAAAVVGGAQNAVVGPLLCCSQVTDAPDRRVDERTLQEIYLPPAAASLQAGPQGVRYGSGTLNGVPLAEAAAALLPQPAAKTNDTPSTTPTHALAVQLATQCGVLVQNLGALPLRAGQRVAYIGAFAETPRYYGEGQPTPAAIGALDAALLKGRRVGYVTGFPANRDERDEGEFLRAVSAAVHADVAVVFAGLPESFVSPDADRRTLRLPDCQNNLIARIAAVQKNTVVVLHTGTPVECPWAGDVSAVLCMYLAGEGVGEATDALLWGDANPSGRLPETWPLRLEDTPCYLDYPGDGRTADYREGVYVGYRWYDARRMPVRWPFGHGMSYTGFVYRNARLSANTLAEGGEVKVCVTVKNSGAVHGAEVVQLYISDETGAPIAGGRVPQVLRGFSKVWLDPGEERDVEFVLTARDLAHYDPARHAWYAAPGRYMLRLGHTSRDIRASLGLNFG